MLLDAPGRPLRAAAVPLPTPGPGQLLLRVRACGVCRTDLHLADGELPDPKLPLVPGHEIVGEVVAAGPGSAAAVPGRLWPKLVLIGAINSALPFALFAWAAQHAPAGISAITNAMAVLFTALVGYLFFGDRIGWRRTLALLVGFAGVVVLASGRTGGASFGWAVLAGCTAAFFYGVGVHLLRRHLAGLPQAAIAAATLGSSALLMLPFAIAQWPPQPVSAASWGSAVVLGVLCTGISYAMYYRLVQRVGPSRAVTVTYLVPLFAVGWAWWLLDEPLTIKMAVAGALILGSVAFSQRSPK